MKKVLFLFLLSFVTLSVTKAQENVVKLGLGSLFQSDVHLKYERAFQEKQSFQVAVLLDFNEKLLTSNFISNRIYEFPYDINEKLGGFAIIPEYRYYLSKKGSPRGFYVDGYLKYRRRNFSVTSDYDTDIEVEGKFKINTFGAGIGIGAQFFLGEHFTLDWNIISIGGVFHQVGFEVGPTNQDDYDELRQEILDNIDENRNSQDIPEELRNNDQVQELIDVFKTTVENAEENRTFSANAGGVVLPDFRFGMSIGYAF